MAFKIRDKTKTVESYTGTRKRNYTESSYHWTLVTIKQHGSLTDDEQFAVPGKLLDPKFLRGKLVCHCRVNHSSGLEYPPRG